MDTDAVLGNLVGSLAGGADLAAFDVLSFVAPGAPHVALGAALSIFRNDDPTGSLWRAVAPETLRAVFAPSVGGEADRGAPLRERGDFATFRGSNAVVFAPRASGVRVKITCSVAAPPAFVAARRVGSGAAAGSLVAAPSAAKAAAALAQNTAAAFEAGEPTAAASWRRVALRGEDVAGRWLGAALPAALRGLGAFVRAADGAWTKQAAAPSAHAGGRFEPAVVVSKRAAALCAAGPATGPQDWGAAACAL